MRNLHEYEKRLIKKILLNLDESEKRDFKSHPMVEEMDDGGMGSIKFYSSNKDRNLGYEVGKFEFEDKDGIMVLVTLSLDNYGDLYELDVWKTDFSPVVEFP